MTDAKNEGQQGQVTLRRDNLWPWIIGIALAVVLAVNAAFIYIAVSGADAVAPSYNSGER
jgi:hypothetical protein